MASASSITLDDLVGGTSMPTHEITSDDIFKPSMGGMEHTGSRTDSYVKPGEGNFGVSMKSALIRDPETQAREAARSKFPNDPSAASKFEIVDGRPAFRDADGTLKYASSKFMDFVAGMVANTPEMVAGAVGSLSSSPVVGGALGVAGARGLKDAAVGAIYGEPQTVGGNLLDVGVNAGMEAATGGVAKTGLAIANRGKTLNVAPRDLLAAQGKRAAIRQSTGVNADLALTSGDPGLLQIRNWLVQQPNQTARAIQAADVESATQFERAISDVLDTVATNGPQDVLGRRGTNAAQAAIDAAKASRDSAVRPYYDQAGKVRLAADVVTDLSGDPLVAQAARAVARDPVYQRQLAGAAPDTVSYWQQVKRRLDAGYQTSSASGNKVAARQYAEAAKSVNEKLAAASPEYKAANDFYAQETTKTVQPLEESVVGVLAKIKDPKAATAAAKIFKDQNLTPADIFNARQVISKQDPEAWNGLVRQFIANEVNAARKVTQAGGERNVAGKLYQRIWGDPQSRTRMEAALGTNASQALRGLMETAEALARAPVSNSNTQPNQAIARVFEGQSANWARVILNPRETLVASAKERTKDKMAEKVWEALSDPAKIAKLKVALAIPDMTKRVAYISAVIAGQSVEPVSTTIRPERRAPQ